MTRDAGDARRDDHIGEIPEIGAFGKHLLREGIERGVRDPAFSKLSGCQAETHLGTSRLTLHRVF